MNRFVFGAVSWALISLFSYTVVIAQTAPSAEVVVTGSRIAQDKSNFAGTLDVITKEQLEASGLRTISDAISKISGIQIKSYGDRGSAISISIRGSSSNQILVLLDGARLPDASAGGYDISNIPFDMVERIEIIKGTTASIYGADAIGGVINIITKKTPVNKEYSLNAFGGSNGLIGVNASYGQTVNNVGLRVAGGMENNDGYRKNDYLEQHFGELKFDFPVTDSSYLKVFVTHVDKEGGVAGNATAVPGLGRKDAASPDNWQEDIEDRMIVEYESDSVPFATVPSKLKMRSYLNNYKRRYFTAATDPFAWAGESLSVHRNRVGIFDFQTDFKVSDGVSVCWGGEAERAEVNSNEIDEHSTNRYASFAEVLFKVKENVSVNVSGRYDDHSVYGGEWTPRIGVSTSLSDNSKVRVVAGEGYRSPTLNDLYWPNDGWTAGNENLKPEHSFEYELGYSRNDVSKHYAVDIALFARNVKDLIKWTETSPWFWQPDNVGKAKAKGVEFKVNYDVPGDKGEMFLNYTFVDMEDAQTGERIYYRAKHLLNLGTRYRLPADIMLFLSGNYVDNYTPIAEKGEEWDDHWLFDVKLSRDVSQFMNSKGDIYIGVDNVFGKKYMMNKGYPSPERTLVFGFNFTY